MNAEFDLDHIFTHHPPNEQQVEQYARIRGAAKEFAQVVIDNSPPCADQSVAIRLIREAMQWAVAAVVLDGRIFKP